MGIKDWDWGSGLGIEIGNWDWGFGIEIGDWDWVRIGIGDCDWFDFRVVTFGCDFWW